MDGRAKRRAASFAVVIAAALGVAWLATSGERARGPEGTAARPRSAPTEADAGAAPPEGGEGPPKPRPAASAPPSAAAAEPYPFANEQPPPDYVGEPDDGGGLPLPVQAPRPDVVVPDEAQLAARQRDTVRFLESEMATLERRAAHAEENGDSALASSLRERRARLEARRDALRALIDP